MIICFPLTSFLGDFKAAWSDFISTFMYIVKRWLRLVLYTNGHCSSVPDHLSDI